MGFVWGWFLGFIWVWVLLGFFGGCFPPPPFGLQIGFCLSVLEVFFWVGWLFFPSIWVELQDFQTQQIKQITAQGKKKNKKDNSVNC